MVKKSYLVLLLLLITILFIFAGCEEETYEVSFDLDGGERTGGGELEQTISEGEKASPPDVYKEGYTFDGWSENFDEISKDISVTALWCKYYDVEFLLNGGERKGGGELEQTVKNGKDAYPPEIEKENYEFVEWDKSYENINDDVQISAVWEKSILSSSEIFDIATKATVEIKTYDKNDEELSLGSGFFINDEGNIVTNYHVLEGAKSAEVIINDDEINERYVYEVKGYDKDTDLAILDIYTNYPHYLETSGTAYGTGDTVYALGSSQGMSGTFSDGIISAVERDIEGIDCIQTTAPISEGNSGGPLLNEYCEVIGINSMYIDSGQNLNFAINIDELKQLDLSESMTFLEFYDETVYYKVKPHEYVVEEIEPNDYADYTAQSITKNGTTVYGTVEEDNFDFYKVYVNDFDEGTLTVALIPDYDIDSEYFVVGLHDDSGEIIEFAERDEYDHFIFYDYSNYGIYYVGVMIADGYPYSDAPYSLYFYYD